ncbi:MAG: hypothetical protein QGD94_00120 [Planctomycetia bacterium]|nr:hypothetical protein [Planctomycetia bacterium]
MKRPTAVTVIGWISIGLGTLIVMVSLQVTFTVFAMRSNGWQWDTHLMRMCILAAIGFFALLSGIGLLKCHRWARTSLVVIALLAVVFVSVIGIWGSISIGNQSPHDYYQSKSWFIALTVVRVATTALLTVILVVSFLAVVHFLFSKTVREAFAEKAALTGAAAAESEEGKAQ